MMFYKMILQNRFINNYHMSGFIKYNLKNNLLSSKILHNFKIIHENDDTIIEHEFMKFKNYQIINGLEYILYKYDENVLIQKNFGYLIHSIDKTNIIYEYNILLNSDYNRIKLIK